MIKAIFFDVDGTLVSHAKKEVCQSARAAIKKLREKGIKCVICTGRHVLELDELPIHDMEFDAYITLVGQLSLDKNRRPFAAYPFPEEDALRFVKLFEEKRYPMQLVEEEGMYINFINRRVEEVQAEISTSLPPLGSYTGNKFYQVVCYVDPGEEAKIKELLEGCYVTRWNKRAIDILPGGGGKALGMGEYLRREGIDRSEIMAFGDGENDADMLEFAGIGVAMGNAAEKAKAAADYVTDHIDSNGVEKALIHFGLI